MTILRLRSDNGSVRAFSDVNNLSLDRYESEREKYGLALRAGCDSEVAQVLCAADGDGV